MRLEKLKEFYKKFVVQNPYLNRYGDYEVNYSMLSVKPENMQKLLSLKGFLTYSSPNVIEDPRVAKLVVDRHKTVDVCFARMPKTTRYNAIWIYVKQLPRNKGKLSKTIIVKFFALCKRYGLLPKYVKPDSMVDKEGNVSVIFDITANSVYDNEQLAYMFFCVVRCPREDPAFVRLVTRMMSLGCHPITSWMFSSACAKATSGHNFVDITAGTYPKFLPPEDIEKVKLSLNVALSIYEITRGGVIHDRLISMRSGLRCATILNKTSIKKTKILKEYFPNDIYSIEEFDKAVYSFKDIYV